MPEPNGVEAPEFYLLGSPLREQHRKLRNEFAGAMRDTKICVVRAVLPLARRPSARGRER